MNIRVLLLTVAALGCSDASQVGGPGSGDSDLAGDSNLGELPALGLYIVNVDGTELRLLQDNGARQVTHVRLHPTSAWMTATRYTHDPDGNGLAMEGEAGHPLNYAGAEVIVFHRDTPDNVTVIAGGADRVTANSSWTVDDRIIFVQQDPDGVVRLKRTSFDTIPTPAQTDIIPVPNGFLTPIDPHQIGPSEASGSIVFSATFHHTDGWMRPVWKMNAAGTTDPTEMEFVGCPICATGCCAWDIVDDVLGTNDPRISHDGSSVIWMHQHPDVSITVGSFTAHPYRQHGNFGAGQVDLTPAGVHEMTSHAYIQWRSDDAEVVYWAIELGDGVPTQPLYRMSPDGTNRQQIPLPDELCTSHPNYLSDDEIVFTGWRCGGPACSCAAGDL